jgi:hypothetical protein
MDFIKVINVTGVIENTESAKDAAPEREKGFR